MSQIKSKQRVKDYGEVFTAEREVCAMLDLVKNETSRIESRFLEPACGNGNFLAEILKRKLQVVKKQHAINYQYYSLISVSTIYGIDILQDNVIDCRERLLKQFNDQSDQYLGVIKHILDLNIVWGDTLALCFLNKNQNPIVLPEWQISKNGDIKRRDYLLSSLIKFDVIIGNPPYRLDDGGHGKSASPLYDKFVLQAKKLNPRYFVMIIPSRWFAGGKGLNEFRSEMLNDTRIKELVDFWDARECFPKAGADVAGGVCYFLWDREYSGTCTIINKHKDKVSVSKRPLNEFDTLVRFDMAVRIIKKVQQYKETGMAEQVSSQNPFGFSTKDRPSGKGELILMSSSGKGKIERSKVQKGKQYIDKWKVITSKASYDHAGQPDSEGKRRVLSKLMILPPSSVCTETYIIVGSFPDEKQAENLVRYMKTKFVRFLISQRSFSQDITRDRFAFVPQQDYSQAWSDEKLYKKYNLSQEEIDFIEAMIRPMD